ncbi:hypothetical protein NDU88_002576 [Pleurodeles waltl]|uniref:Uncharacterized protein n=1 Tax=Pleurodeles waltl TaxID=8319 RepID=A0AAV7UBM2_PLEWA|nr:hypothetical protein NDU88_002576 [Pleurodeles waltl]
MPLSCQSLLRMTSQPPSLLFFIDLMKQRARGASSNSVEHLENQTSVLQAEIPMQGTCREEEVVGMADEGQEQVHTPSRVTGSLGSITAPHIVPSQQASKHRPCSESGFCPSVETDVNVYCGNQPRPQENCSVVPTNVPVTLAEDMPMKRGRIKDLEERGTRALREQTCHRRQLLKHLTAVQMQLDLELCRHLSRIATVLEVWQAAQVAPTTTNPPSTSALNQDSEPDNNDAPDCCTNDHMDQLSP